MILRLLCIWLVFYSLLEGNVLTDCVSIGQLQGSGSRLQLESRNFEFKIDYVFRGGGGGGWWRGLSRDY
jgi:hypothetical protein